jgi:uncharacterized membrane protein YtjA (UPF0391 family)
MSYTERVRKPLFTVHYGKEKSMFRWGIIFLVIALIAAALGFGGLAGTAAGLRKLSLSSVLFCSWSACLQDADVLSGPRCDTEA